ncbi:MAG TPA: tRNA (adenosine(37)-N6)-threonylcarbamoyltransferase complex dimerization subunit type 1 TsaB [Kiritimatiellia bacterium]|nr:tRNA (adenosine(37)-N6)-threonylcarbamoyltransferase complex dimerization subunit type 1 TsaB [Kiritimatiellia bacterium]HRU71401.1 tRNA (adenosine(37)-N6)-threonylcarbamoyltransferase complex dimerization subunit type 1 TsaB [Kiritimatiellia bacterium]
MRSLVIDRSSGRPSAAVFEGKACVCEKVWDGEPTRAPAWMADLADWWAEHGWDGASFDAFVCGLGPGSFSGIRASLSALQGLALPDNKPVYGVASAAALALGQAQGEERVTVVGDARRSRLWCVTYEVRPADAQVRLLGGGLPTHTAEDFQLVPAEALGSTAPDATRIVTTDWERLAPWLRATFAEDRLVTHAAHPSATDAGRVALASSTHGVLEPLPIYLHPAVAVAAG